MQFVNIPNANHAYKLNDYTKEMELLKNASKEFVICKNSTDRPYIFYLGAVDSSDENK